MFRLRLHQRLAVLLIFGSRIAPAAEQWLRIQSSNFELYTTAGEKKGREAILYFEQVRSLFRKLAKSDAPSGAPVRLIAFQSEKSYKPYRINDFATAYYLGSPDRDYIVMQSISSEQYPIAIHEYTHLIVQHSGLKLPAWLNEGLADLFSTLKPYGKQVRLGDLMPGRMQELRNNRWLDLESLIQVDHRSPFYSEKQRRGYSMRKAGRSRICCILPMNTGGNSAIFWRPSGRTIHKGRCSSGSMGNH